MKIIVAQTAGFCMGVHRAVDLAVDNATDSSKKIYTLGPLIHNSQTLEMLRKRGIEVLDESRPPPPDATILVRAHGVPAEVEKRYASRGHLIIDGTCPKVKTVHKVIRKYRELGFQIVVAGDEGHSEVVGLMSYAADAGHLIQSARDVNRLPEFDRLCLVSQTTFDLDTFEEIAQRLHEKYDRAQVVVKRTICAATRRRQEETRNLAGSVDAMIVVGGKNSANTLRLAKISRECGTHTQHIETEREIDWQPLADCNTVGVTAGASTPSWMIKRVRDHVRFLANASGHTLGSRARQLFDVLVNLNIFVAAGGAAMYYASCVVQGLPFAPFGAVLTFLYLMSIYLWNSLTSIEITRHLGIGRYRFYSAHRRGLMGLALVCIGCILGFSFAHSHGLFYLMLIATVAGSVYHFTIVPQALRRIVKYRNLKDIPTSRDLFAALAWGVVVTFVPQGVHAVFVLEPATVAMFLWAFFLAYLRSVMFDLRDIEGDRIMGRETLVTVIGERMTRRFILVALWTSLVVLVGLFALSSCLSIGAKEAVFLFQIPVLLYLWIVLWYQQHESVGRTAVFSLVADGQFYVAALGAWAAAFSGV